MTRFPSFSLCFAIFALVLPLAATTRTLYRAENISEITLYGDTAVYLPSSCPQAIEFTARARHLPELAEDKIGIFTRELIVDGSRCTSDATMLDFSPIGPTDHYPPQWVVEDSRFHGQPVNFTCGGLSFSLRFGYFNDVSTAGTGGFLKPEVVYLDFAVIPNTRPFGYCSYAGRRDDGKRPLDYAPFPSKKTWESFHELRKRTHPQLKHSDDTDVSPEPEQSMEAEPIMEEMEDEDINQQDMPSNNVEQTMAPGQDRAPSMNDPFR